MTDWVSDWDAGVDVGRYDDGSRMTLPVPGWKGASLIIAGSSGSGKTSLARLLIVKLKRMFGPNVAFLIIDPHLVGFRRVEPLASCVAYGNKNAPAGLALAEDEMNKRYREMYRLGIEEWTPDVAHLIGPYLIVMVDELAAITLAPKPAKVRGEPSPPSAEERLISLSQQMRKTGGGLVLGAQSPKVNVINGLIQEQCPVRWCGRTKRAEQTEAVLESRGYPCHLPNHPKGIPLWMVGGAYVDDGSQVRRGRSTGIRSDVVDLEVVEFAQYTHDFGWPRVIHPFDLATTGGK